MTNICFLYVEFGLSDDLLAGLELDHDMTDFFGDDHPGVVEYAMEGAHIIIPFTILELFLQRFVCARSKLPLEKSSGRLS